MSEVIGDEFTEEAIAVYEFQAQLPDLDGALAVTFAVDVRLTETGDLKPIPVSWNPDGFSLFVSENSIRASVKSSDGAISRFKIKSNEFSDLEWHKAELTIDTVNDIFRVAIDGRPIFERVDLDVVLPPTLTETQLGEARGWSNSAVGIVNAIATAAKMPGVVVSTLQNDGRIDLDFDAGEAPVGLLLRGNAAVDTGVLRLDGQKDYAVLTEKHSLEGAGYLSVEMEFRFWGRKWHW